ncbi:MAG: DUF4270 domain-containing protein [Bacteroidota bacterium]|nr:DUF4270 domain-containing protein [Bacteroidota bacterium]
MLNCRFKPALPVVFLLLFLNWSCTKIDTTELGQDLIPAVDNIHTFETTFDVVANNFDNVISTCDSVHYADAHALGIINNDPLFGKTSANIYVEFKPASFPFTFPKADTLSLDSVVLVLHFAYSFGDTTQQQKVQVYSLTNPLHYDSTYTTCDVLPYNNFELLGEKTYAPQDINDSVHAFREDASNELRIKISNAFAQELIDHSAYLASDSAFKEHFNGFAIIADQSSGGNALSYFDITSANSRLSIYARTSTAGVKDTLVYDFPFTGLSGQGNSIVRERGNSEITNNVTHPPAGNDLVYIQTSPGSYANLTIPGLTGLSNRVINRAELIAEQVYSPTDDVFAAPNYLFLDTKDSSTTGRYIPIPCDFTIVSQRPNFGYFGGNKKVVNDDQGHPIARYVFNISRYVQNIVTKKTNNDTLRLSAPYNIVNPKSYIDRCGQGVSLFNYTINTIADGRIKLNGTNGTPGRLRLHVIYSIL